VHGDRARLARQGSADGGQAFVALDWKIMKPLRVGDTMRTTSRIVSKRPMRDGGLIVDERTILDQHGEVVQQGRFTFLVAKRQKEASA
jgi:acyl dehydratase